MTDTRATEGTQLAGRRVLVTGAARGVGEAIARRLVGDGAAVLLGDVQSDAVDALAGELGAGAVGVELDVTDPRSWDAAVLAADAELGGLDGLVNNAGVLHLGPLEEMEPDQMARLLSVNLLGPMLGIRAVTPLLRGAGGGGIVNISSIAGLEGMNANVAYAASKWGVRGATRSAAIELGRDGIRVNAVCPSMGNPAMFEPFLARMDLHRYMDGAPEPVLVRDGVPREVDMEDVVQAVVWLLGEGSSACTGTDIVVDAGWTAGTNAPGLPGF